LGLHGRHPSVKPDESFGRPLFTMRALSDAPLSPLLGALVRHYDLLIEQVRRHARRFGGDGSAAADVVHDICVQLIESPPPQPVHTPLAFLRSITLRRAIDRHRVEAGRAQWVQSTDDPDAVALAAQHAADPGQIVEGRQQLQRLAQAIEALPPRCRDVFVLHKIHQKTQAEVAVHLGISLKTVEKHMRLGLAACREALALP
jgi:RNA polymerase sigma factor (sigma-70 family)